MHAHMPMQPHPILSKLMTETRLFYIVYIETQLKPCNMLLLGNILTVLATRQQTTNKKHSLC